MQPIPTLLQRIRHRRVGRIAVLVLILLTTTVQAAQACGFACIFWYGFIEVQDGNVYIYSGCFYEGNSIYCVYGGYN